MYIERLGRIIKYANKYAIRNKKLTPISNTTPVCEAIYLSKYLFWKILTSGFIKLFKPFTDLTT